jgi:hypothetical protein
MCDDQVLDYRKARSTVATDTSFPALVVTATEPQGNGVVEVSKGPLGPSRARVLIFGTGADDAVLTGMRIVCWDRGGVGSTILWFPRLLSAPFAAVLSTSVGVAGGLIDASDRLADTITNADTAITSVSDKLQIVSPTNNIPAHISFDLKGARKLQFDFDLGANMTGANALVAFY